MAEELLLVIAAILLVFVTIISQRLRPAADVVCFGLAGLFLYSLLKQHSNLNSDEWSILSALLFVMSFAYVYRSSSKKAGGHISVAYQEKNTRIDFAIAVDVTQLDNHAHSDRLATVGLIATQFFHEGNLPVDLLRLKIDELRKNKANCEIDSLEYSMRSLENHLQSLGVLARSVRQYSSLIDEKARGFVAIQEVFALVKVLSEPLFHGKGVEVRWPTYCPAIVVSGGLTHHAQVLLNLLKNAFGSISDQTENKSRWVAIEISDRGGVVEVSVSSGGREATSGIRGSLSRPFVATKSEAFGADMSLALCRDLVESMGGDIWYEGMAKAARFTLRYSYLPAVNDPFNDFYIGEHETLNSKKVS